MCEDMKEYLKMNSHRIINSDTGECYCPKIKGITQSYWTPKGIECSNCAKKIY